MKKKIRIRVIAEFEFETELEEIKDNLDMDGQNLDDIVVEYMQENNFPVDEFDEWYVNDVEEI